MPNTLGTLAGINVVQDVLSTLLVEFPVLSQIATDFTSKGGHFNQVVSTRVIIPTVAVEHDPNTGYVATGRTAIDVNLTINKQAEHTYEVTDREQSQTSRRLRDEFVQTSAHALGIKIVNDLFATALAATYPLLFSSSAANFDSADVRKIRTLLNKAGVPDMGRFLVINSDFAEGMGLDNLIVANPNGSNADVINTGKLPKIHNFECSEFASLPDNGEKLAGIGGNREGIVMATRLPDVPANSNEIPGIIRNITEPNSGLSVQLRRYYDMKLAKLVESITVMYGFTAGLSEAGLSKRLVRVVTP